MRNLAARYALAPPAAPIWHPVRHWPARQADARAPLRGILAACGLSSLFWLVLFGLL